uniref:Uncharacterized protein n=1 Tax=uncultured Armatimonadetes bacterium TaxID=157466 RepID=A0A6J4HWS0_9BACT|nr:hypothetical protein AVDCRST_MAG63-1195 [uncultured Armatimonadetes bacterium]
MRFVPCSELPAWEDAKSAFVDWEDGMRPALQSAEADFV